MDRIFFQERRAYLNKQLQDQRSLELKARKEKREEDRLIHYGNIRYLEGQLDCIDKMVNGAFGFKVQ